MSGAGYSPALHQQSKSFAIPLSELNHAVDALVELLETVETCGWSLYEGPALERAIWRYETMWLPLVAAVTQKIADTGQAKGAPTDASATASTLTVSKLRKAIPESFTNLETMELVPPLDVAWVWYLHRLSPTQYLEDVARIAGIPIMPHAATAFEYDDSEESRLARLWNVLFAQGSDMHSSFFPEYLDSIIDESGQIVCRALLVGSVKGVTFSSQITCDIRGAVKAHRGALCAVQRSEALYPGYLFRAVTRYHDFMQIQANCLPASLYVPSDIDFVWRAHAASTADYLNDGLVGKALCPKSGDEKVYLAHPLARALSMAGPEGGPESRRSLSGSSRIWTATYGDARGPFVVPQADLSTLSRTRRDGYLQDLLRRMAEDDTSEESDVLEDGERRQQSPEDVRSQKDIFPVPPSPSFSPAAAVSPAGSAKSPFWSVGKSPADRKSRTSQDFKDVQSASMGSSDVKVASPQAQSLFMRLSLGRMARSPAGLRDDQANATGGKLNEMGDDGQMPKRATSPAALQGTGDGSGAQPKHAGPRSPKDMLGHDHTGRKKPKQKLEGMQLLRGMALCVLGIILDVVGIIYMAESSNSNEKGVLLFSFGLFSFLIAAMVWLRPDQERRIQHKEDRRRRRAAREADEREKKEKKENSRKFHDGIQMHSFISNEACVMIGGDGVAHLTTARAGDVNV